MTQVRIQALIATSSSAASEATDLSKSGPPSAATSSADLGPNVARLASAIAITPQPVADSFMIPRSLRLLTVI